MSSSTDKRLLVLGTHHKTGAVWLGSIFKKFAAQSKLKCFDGLQEDCPEDADIFWQQHSMIDMIKLQQRFPARTIRGVHIIRDPRDVIISGAFYHTHSQESWLHEPSKSYGGLTYQEKINSFPTDEGKFIFEMDYAGNWCIMGMSQWNYQDEHFFELRYEELIVDSELHIFREAFQHLGLVEKELELALKIAAEASMFSPNFVRNSHIRCGKAKQWEKHFTPELCKIFHDKFPNALELTGYK